MPLFSRSSTISGKENAGVASKPSHPKSGNKQSLPLRHQNGAKSDIKMEGDDSDSSEYASGEEAMIEDGDEDKRGESPTFELTWEHDELFDWANDGVMRSRRQLIWDVLGPEDGRRLTNLLHEVQQRVEANEGKRLPIEDNVRPQMRYGQG